MAAIPVTVAEGKEFTVTDVGVLVTFSNSLARKITIKSADDNTTEVAYSFQSAINDGSAAANAAAIKAAYMYVSPGDARVRENLNATALYLRTASGLTAVVKVETV